MKLITRKERIRFIKEIKNIFEDLHILKIKRIYRLHLRTRVNIIPHTFINYCGAISNLAPLSRKQK